MKNKKPVMPNQGGWALSKNRVSRHKGAPIGGKGGNKQPYS